MSATPRQWRYDVCVKSVRSGVTFRIIDTGRKLIGHFTGSPEYAALIVRAVNERDGLLAQIMKLTGTVSEKGDVMDDLISKTQFKRLVVQEPRAVMDKFFALQADRAALIAVLRRLINKEWAIDDARAILAQIEGNKRA